MKLLDLFFPPRCIFCGQVSGQPCCPACATGLPRCPTPFTQTPGNPYRWLAASFVYEGRLRDAIHRFKFRGQRQSAPFFAQAMWQTICQAQVQQHFNLVTCVPMHPRKQAERGYNQADLLAKALAKLAGVQYAPQLLAHLGESTQHRLTAAERRQAARHSYAIRNPLAAKGGRILVVDDIFTTGATMQACCNCLLQAGAAQTFGAVAAMVEAKGSGVPAGQA